MDRAGLGQVEDGGTGAITAAGSGRRPGQALQPVGARGLATVTGQPATEVPTAVLVSLMPHLVGWLAAVGFPVLQPAAHRGFGRPVPRSSPAS